MRTGARLGQHFLKNVGYAARLANAANITEGDTVVEIGPGRGVLTRELLKTGARVIAIEKDEVLVAELHETFRGEIAGGRLQLISGDVRDFVPEEKKYVVAANIPYYITGEIIRKFLTAAQQPRTIALLVQKEVADRIVARNGKESIVSLSVKAYGTPKVVAKVSRGNFSPPPSVDSAILLIEHISKKFFSDISEEDFFHVVRAGFSSKRKMLAGNLGKVFGKEKVLAALATCGIPPKARAEDVGLVEWKQLTHALVG